MEQLGSEQLGYEHLGGLKLFGWIKAKLNHCSSLGRRRGINFDIRCKQRTDSAIFDFDRCTLCIFSTMRNHVVERLRGPLSLNIW
mmetsp:Transcript_13397/g.33728  ORF Transcript_13397/g.33728 Transcript_13397/m.33728 type:complete len:85 (+) Transcript_13397:198-452(+)